MSQLTKMRTRKWIIPLLNLAILISIVSFVGFIAKNNYAQAICSCPRGCTILFEGECICSCPEPTPTTPEPTTPEPTTPPPCVSTGCGTYNCGVDNCGNSCGDCDAGDRCSGGICETQYSRCVNGSCADAWMTKSKSANDGCVNNQCIAIQHCTWESCDVGTHTCSMHNEKDILASETCPKSCGENSCAAGNTCPMGYCRALNGIFHCSATSVAKNPDGSCPTSYCTDGTNCTVESPEPPESSNACSVTATATPNPIPTGQNQTTISATSLSHTSLSKCKVDTYTLSHTFTQTDSSHTYTVSCTGDAGYNNCSSEITVTKETTEPSCTVTATANPNPIPQGQNQTTISATSLSHTSLSKCKVDTYSLPHTFTQTDSSHTYTVSCGGDTVYGGCHSEITVTKETTESSCTVTATANPNPIPQGQNQTTISATSLSHTSLSKCKVDTYSLPHTFTQTDSSHTYMVICTGDAGYNDCGRPITVTKGGAPSATITLSADKYTVLVNENVKFTAKGSGDLSQTYGLDWIIGDITQCQHYDGWGDCGKFKSCQKMGGGMPFNSNSHLFISNLVKPLIAQQAQAVNLTSTLTYSWSKKGNYNVKVQGKDLAGNPVTSNTVMITVSIVPPPTCSVSLTASPKIVLLGRSLTLTWSMNDACSGCKALCSYSDDTNAYPQCGPEWKGLISSTSGSKSVTPQAKGTYTYTISCNGGTAEATVTVQVILAPWWREIIPNLLPFLRGMIR